MQKSRSARSKRALPKTDPSQDPVDEGYFPAGSSMLRQVHDERIVGLYYGQRTALVGALDALLYESTELHTRRRDRPWARLSRTARGMETVFFGTRAEADDLLRRVAKMHSRVQGVMPESSHPQVAGRAYAALQPILAYRTIGSMADSALVLYERFVRHLSDDEKEHFWQDYLFFGKLFGMQPGDAPGSYSEFRAEWDEWIAGPTTFLTPSARKSALETALNQPLPRFQKWSNSVLGHLIVVGTLPTNVREIYDLHWSRSDDAAQQALAVALHAARPLIPPDIRTGRNTRNFDLVQRIESERLAAGLPTWRIGPDPSIDLGFELSADAGTETAARQHAPRGVHQLPEDADLEDADLPEFEAELGVTT